MPMGRVKSPNSTGIKVDARYLARVRQFPLRPIRTAAEHDAAITLIDELIDARKLTLAEKDYLEVLSNLVEAYEDRTCAMKPACDADMLRFLIEQNGISQAQTAAGTAIPESTISEVISGKRKLNRGQIAKIASFFRVEPGVFLTSVD